MVSAQMGAGRSARALSSSRPQGPWTARAACAGAPNLQSPVGGRYDRRGYALPGPAPAVSHRSTTRRRPRGRPACCGHSFGGLVCWLRRAAPVARRSSLRGPETWARVAGGRRGSAAGDPYRRAGATAHRSEAGRGGRRRSRAIDPGSAPGGRVARQVRRRCRENRATAEPPETGATDGRRRDTTGRVVLRRMLATRCGSGCPRACGRTAREGHLVAEMRSVRRRPRCRSTRGRSRARARPHGTRDAPPRPGPTWPPVPTARGGGRRGTPGRHCPTEEFAARVRRTTSWRRGDSGQ